MTEFLLRFLTLLKLILIKVRICIFNTSNSLKNKMINFYQELSSLFFIFIFLFIYILYIYFYI